MKIIQHKTVQRIVAYFFFSVVVTILTAFALNSCGGEDNPVNLLQPITLPFSPYDTPEGVGTENTITGGVGKYTMSFLGDSSILRGYVRTDNVLYLKGLKKGITEIELTDEAGNTSGKLPVEVKEFVVRPRSLDVPIRTSGGFSFNFENYGVTVKMLDTTLANMTYASGGYVSFRGKKFGSTTVRFTCTQTQSVQEFPLNVVELRPAELTYTSAPVSFTVKNGRVTDRSVTIGLDRQKYLSVRSELDRNADTTFRFHLSPNFPPPVSVGDSSFATALLMVNGKDLHLFSARVLITSVSSTAISGTFKGITPNPSDSGKTYLDVSGTFSGQFYTTNF